VLLSVDTVAVVEYYCVTCFSAGLVNLSKLSVCLQK